MTPDAVLLLGPTGAGKSPLGDVLERRGLLGRPCRHFDFGARLRAAAAVPPEGFDAAEVAVVRRVLATGALLEDREFPIARKLLAAFLAGLPPGALVVLNGLPRHSGQARMMEGLVRVRAVALLDCPPVAVLERVRANAGGDRGGRPDDDPVEVARRVALYEERTRPLVRHFETEGARVVRIPVAADQTPEQAYEALAGELGRDGGIA